MTVARVHFRNAIVYSRHKVGYVDSAMTTLTMRFERIRSEAEQGIDPGVADAWIDHSRPAHS